RGTFRRLAYAAAEVLAARHLLDLLLARGNKLVAVAVDANVCVGHTQALGRRERDARETRLVHPGGFRGLALEYPGRQRRGTQRQPASLQEMARRSAFRRVRSVFLSGHGPLAPKWKPRILSRYRTKGNRQSGSVAGAR